ncbi:MAG TPA: TspO/MBR family protein [Burkholderiales bacterium]|nr:TspO/MBR family protein [Burkholderiales bacterium]
MSGVLGLVGWILVAFVPAWVGALATDPGWYAELARPAWAPPAGVFAPVWTVLYFLMGVAAWLVWRSHGFAGAPKALALFLAHLPFNAAWTWIFFGLREPGLALAEIALLWALIAATMIAFACHRRLAGALLAPYLAWVTYAAALNHALWRLNP